MRLRLAFLSMNSMFSLPTEISTEPGQANSRFDLFQRPEWLEPWWRHLAGGSRASFDRPHRHQSIDVVIDGQMGFLPGTGVSDYLDVQPSGATEDEVGLLLSEVFRRYPDTLGFRFHLVPDSSPTSGAIAQASQRLGLLAVEEDWLAAPKLQLLGNRDHAIRAANKSSLRRHEAKLKKLGRLDALHTSDASIILPFLSRLFEQHQDRWRATPTPSRFNRPEHRRFLEDVTRRLHESGCLRFTALLLDEEPVAFHFGFHSNGTTLWYLPTYDLRFAQCGPGEVLLRHVLLQAIEEGADVFDFGIGDEPYKRRFADSQTIVRTWGVYPPELAGGRSMPTQES